MKMCDKESLKKLLSNAIPLLCKNGLPMHSSFRIDAMIGITIGSADASTLICFSETITPNSEPSLLEYAQQIDSDEFENSHNNNSSFNRCTDDENENSTINNNEDSFDISIKPEPGDIEELTPQNQSLQQTHRNKRNASGNSKRSKSLNANYSANDYTVIDDQQSQHYPQVKQELIDIADDENIKDTSGGGGDIENTESYNDQNLPTNEYNQNVTVVNEWSAHHNDWNNGNTEFQQEQMSSYSNRVSKYPVRNKKSNKKYEGQKLNVSDAMTIDASAFIDTTNQTASGSTTDYNNLMQDICEFVMSQSQKITDKSKPQSRTCHICQATLSNPLSLKNHIQGTHLALKLRRCNLCGETFKWTMQLARHKKRVHGGGAYLDVYNVWTPQDNSKMGHLQSDAISNKVVLNNKKKENFT